MYSFYGGRPGNSFVIITAYASVADMVANFKLGPAYTNVHYDEHVIINTINKNDPDNGKIYRRGYNFNNDMGGAEYIGTIVGPSGPAPMLELTTIADVNTHHAAQGFDEHSGSGSYNPVNGNLVPGKTSDGNFNDSITWSYCSIRDENNTDCIAYIGFTFPYPVIEFETNIISSYDSSSVTRLDDETHPFYQKWNINIPKGIKGDSVKNLIYEVASNDIVIDDNYDQIKRADDVNHEREVLTYEYYDYDNNESGNPTKHYLGDYNMIKNINLADNGTLSIDYTHNDTQVIENKIKWIKTFELDNTTGELVINYNTGDVYENTLNWVSGIDITEDGIVKIKTVDNTQTELSNHIKWIDEISLNDNTGELVITYNTGETSNDLFIDYVKNITVEAGGTIRVNHAHSGTTSLTNKIKWVNNFAVQNESYSGAGEGTGDQKLYVTWNDGISESIGNPLNYVMEMALDQQNRLLVYYSDPAKREAAEETITFNNKSGWINLGTVVQQVAYTSGSTMPAFDWIGTGQIIDSGNGTGSKKIKFMISPAAVIDAPVIRVTGGTLTASGLSNNISLTTGNASVTKTPFGLQFEVTTNEANTTQQSKNFISVSIENLGLSFNAN